MPYHFRVGFSIAGDRAFKDEFENLPIYVEGQTDPLTLTPTNGDTLANANRFALTGPEYPTRTMAEEAGRKTITSMLYYSAQYGRGIDLGSEAPFSGTPKEGRDWFEENYGINVLNDQLGLIIFEVPPVPIFLHGSAKLSVLHEASELQVAFKDSFGHYALTDDSVATAAHLFGLSFFEQSSRSRLLTLITVCELLVTGQQQDENPKVVAWIDKFVEDINKTEKDENIRNKLCSRLGNIRKESITQRGARCAKHLLTGRQYDSREPSKFFRALYGKRSALVHEAGIAPDEIRALIGPAREFTRDLLLASMRA